ncbi:MAG: hypothetical protein P4L85_14035 [Paludisphaera borealis]|uniref:hypothetical protein n=1 Tax=Paludisphaera borealis TaxID=1387353 RepID=UPI00285241BE|nr:hypothetical protein [Paludisphaera borealis]MDR3620466.1 hypothetical protein [Paludisphaera borealis]
MADVYDFQKSAEKLGKAPEQSKAEELTYSPLSSFYAMCGVQPPAVFDTVDSTAMGACHEITSVETRAPEPPEPEI